VPNFQVEGIPQFRETCFRSGSLPNTWQSLAEFCTWCAVRSKGREKKKITGVKPTAADNYVGWSK